MVSFTPLNMQKVAYLSDFLLFCTLFELDCIIFQMVKNVPFLAIFTGTIPPKQFFFPCVYEKCFQKCFHGVGFDAIIAYHENQYTSQLDLRSILLNDYIITTE